MDEQLKNILDLMGRPAFCVESGCICHINPAAQPYLLSLDTAIEPLLACGQEEYATFTDGSLYLTLDLGGATCGAKVMPVNQFHIFFLDTQTADTELRALALAAKELREPMTGILAAADQVQNPQMNRRLFQLMRIVTNMSDAFRYCQMDSSRIEFLQVTSLYDEIFQRAEELLEKAGIHLEYAGLSEPVFTLADPELLERAAYNLLSNAAKFAAKDGRIQVQLSCKGNRLSLSVIDNGPGIPRDILENLYNRFQREPALEDPRYGIGLGLVLVRACAALHGGAVLVDQKEGQGNRTTMTMQLRQPKQATLRSPTMRIDYAGEWDHALLELSDCLPAELYK